MSDHVLPVRIYYGVFGALMGFTALTTWIAYQDLGAFNTPVALGIAALKASLVVLYFMHVRYAGKLVWLFAATGFLWLVILLALTMQDYGTRAVPPGWAN